MSPEPRTRFADCQVSHTGTTLRNKGLDVGKQHIIPDMSILGQKLSQTFKVLILPVFR
jgi:hypothetical protein